MTDVVLSILTFLKNESSVMLLAGGRIYGDELPESEVINMPRKCVVIMETGGLERNDFLPINQPRLDIYCYGETFYEAGKLDRAVSYALKHLKRLTISNSLIHGVALGTGAHSLKDPDTGWRLKMRSITVSIDEREVE
jgi:hypothetical protein